MEVFLNRAMLVRTKKKRREKENKGGTFPLIKLRPNGKSNHGDEGEKIEGGDQEVIVFYRKDKVKPESFSCHAGKIGA